MDRAFSEMDRAFFEKDRAFFGNGPGLFGKGPVSARAFLNGISGRVRGGERENVRTGFHMGRRQCRS